MSFCLVTGIVFFFWLAKLQQKNDIRKNVHHFVAFFPSRCFDLQPLIPTGQKLVSADFRWRIEGATEARKGRFRTVLDFVTQNLL